MTITRVDKDDRTYFYYGDYRKSHSLPKEYILATYPGFNHVMSAVLTFQKNRQVTFINMGDGLEKIGKTDSMAILSYSDPSDFNKWWDKIQLHYDNIVQVDDALQHEKELNKYNNSKVIAIYSSDD